MKEDTRATLPRVSRIIPGEGQSFTLELEGGKTVALRDGDRAALSPLQADGLAALTYQWGRADAAVYAVPAALYPELLPYFR